jgi:5-methyltetrahydrofolate--homocysteine methyltransferase
MFREKRVKLMLDSPGNWVNPHAGGRSLHLLELLEKRLLIADGATGTELMRLGAPGGVPSDLLNLQKPEVVEQVHRAYVEAGSDLIVTNTFGATRIKLERHGAAAQVREINRAAVNLARRASQGSVLVAGDIGPTGQMLKPYGPADPSDVRDAYAEQADILAETGVDAIILETFFDLAEALLALEAAVRTNLPVIVSMTFDLGPRGVFTIMGNSAADCARALADGGAAVVGANCTVTVDTMIQVGQALQQATTLPLILQPNAGNPEVIDGKTLYRETPEHFASRLPELIAAGGRIIGGCCGTDPRFIAAVKTALETV